jgi:hypothetical protein
MDTRFIRVLQKDIVTKPEQWKDSKPGKFIKLSNRAKNVYCVLSVIAYSSAGNAKGTPLKNNHKLGEHWFWTSHRLLQQLTESSQKTVQRGIKELVESGLIEYHASKAQGQKCFFKIKRIKYNQKGDKVAKGPTATLTPKPSSVGTLKPDQSKKPDLLHGVEIMQLFKYHEGFKELMTADEIALVEKKLPDIDQKEMMDRIGFEVGIDDHIELTDELRQLRKGAGVSSD